MKNELFPFKGVGTILFGMTRNEVRSCMKRNGYTTFMRNQFAENTSDYYAEMGIFVEYDRNDVCNAVELTEDSNCIWNGEDLLQLSYSALRNMCDPLSQNKEEEQDVGITYHDLGFGATQKTGKDIVETVLVFSGDYW